MARRAQIWLPWLLITATGNPHPLKGQAQEYDWQAMIEMGPVFTPFQVPPEILNPEELREASEVAEAYIPPGTCSTTRFWFLVGPTGKTHHIQVAESSGDGGRDELALVVASRIRFSPALSQGHPVAVWVNLPVMLQSGECGRDPRPELREARAPSPVAVDW